MLIVSLVLAGLRSIWFDMRNRRLNFSILVVLLVFLTAGLVACERPVEFQPRNIPLRWIELHAPRHPECQNQDGTVLQAPLPTIHPNTWNSSEWVHWVVSRMNNVYDNTGVQFWVQSHEVYCTDTLARFLADANGVALTKQLIKPYLGSEVYGDISLFYPQAQFSTEELNDSLSRQRWIQRAVALYGDPHAMPIFFHNDYQAGTSLPKLVYNDTNGDGLEFVLPQHGFAPWDSPGLAFLFLSATTWDPGWQFDPELTVAHEIGHALGNPHTLDFDIFAIGKGVFPDNSKYSWADFWDLIYVDSPSGLQGVSDRKQIDSWLAKGGDTSLLRRIDDRWNIVLDKSDGRMAAQLNYKAADTVFSETMLPSIEQGNVRLLQGLSFEMTYAGLSATQPYQWQHNLMAYRYPDHVFPPTFTGDKFDSVDPFDFLAGRFSQSQIEVMHKQLGGSTTFTDKNYGPVTPATAPLFASRFDLLGTGPTEPFVWYSNGEGPDSIDTLDNLPDMVAFRAAPIPAATFFPGLEIEKVIPLEIDISPQRLLAGDFNGDGRTDLLWTSVEEPDSTVFLWSTGQNNLHSWRAESVADLPDMPDGFSPLLVADFDGNNVDDLLFSNPDSDLKIITFFGDIRDCNDFDSCYSRATRVTLPEMQGPYAAGDFDGLNGDDLVWVSYKDRNTYATMVWSGRDGQLAQGQQVAVGPGRYYPYAGDFNGTGGDDIMWYHEEEPEIFWWGSGGDRGNAPQQMLCGGGGPTDCIDATFQMPSVIPFPKITIGDFDGNGADDVMVHDSHEPAIFFSTINTALAYKGNNVLIRVALYDSSRYLTLVGEFDHALYQGKALGDDIALLYAGS